MSTRRVAQKFWPPERFLKGIDTFVCAPQHSCTGFDKGTKQHDAVDNDHYGHAQFHHHPVDGNSLIQYVRIRRKKSDLEDHGRHDGYGTGNSHQLSGDHCCQSDGVRKQRPELRTVGLNIREWRVIALLGQLGPLTASQIVQEIAHDKANISRAISRLDHLGLVAKLPNPKHKRSPIIWMTKEGMNRYKRIVPEFNDQATMFCESLTDKEERTLCRLLDKLKAHSEQVRDREGL